MANNDRISASLLGTYAYCEKAALLSREGREVSKEAMKRMEDGRKNHMATAVVADRIARRQRANVALAIVVIVLIVILILGLGG